MPTTKVPASRMISYDTGSFCFRNKIINGDMRIDQRNAGAAATLASGVFTYTVDRWTVGTSGSTGTSQRITDPTTGLYSLRVTGAAGNTAISFNQRIESQNALELVNKVVNLSFDMFASTNISVEWQIAYPTIQDNFTNWTVLGSGTVNVTTTRTTFNTGPVTLDNNVNKGLLVRFVVLNHTAGKTIDITNVQLEVGPTATPFEYRPIGTELALCQRYFEIVDVFPTGVTFGPNGDTRGNSVNYKVTKRTTPTLNPTSTPISIISVGSSGNGANLNGSVPYITTSQTLFVYGVMGNFANIAAATGGGVFAWADNAIRTVTASAEL